MSTPYLGEIRVTSFSFAPIGWLMCNGQLLPINQYQALFAILGTTYGGNGVNNFQLPNLQGRVPIHFGAGFTQGQQGGEAAHTLTLSELPAHTHQLYASADLANASLPANALPAVKPRGGRDIYGPVAAPTPLESTAVGATGGSQPHENRPPYLTLNFIIAMSGIFPSRA